MVVTRLILFTLALCSFSQLADAARLQRRVNENVTVRLLLTRHAFSCANAVDQFGINFWEKKKHIVMKDPFLTDCGVHRSKKGAAQLHKIRGSHVDLVLASSMLRAMETAAFMYPNQTIIPCPYISEEGGGADNVPRDVQDQLKLLKTDRVIQRNGLNVDLLDLQWMESDDFSGGPRREPSWPNFKKFMAETLLPSLPTNLRKKDLTIAVVTHSHFLKKIPELMSNCNSYYTDKPKNNQVFELRYRFSTKLRVRESEGVETFPPKFINPYSSTSSAWSYIKALFAEGNNTDIAFGKFLDPKSPPWKTSDVSLRIERDFEFDSDTGCKNLIDVQDKDEHMCEMDYGEVCQGEKSRPKLKFIEQRRIDAEQKLERYKKEGRSDKVTEKEIELAELQKFVCCTV